MAEPAGIYFRPALLVEPDGSLVVAAAHCTAAQCDGTIRRYDPDGRPDPSFTPVDRFVDSPTYAEVVAYTHSRISTPERFTALE